MFVGIDYNRIQKDGTKEATVYKKTCNGDTPLMPPIALPSPKELEFSVWQNSYLEDLGFFTQTRYFINSNFVLDAGLRVDFIKSDILDPEKDFIELYGGNIRHEDETNFNYFGKLKYNLPKNIDVELAFGRGTRNASLLEKYINHFTVGLDSYEYVGNPHLESEVNHQVDLTLSKKHKSFYAFVNVFYSRIQDYITAEVDTNIKKKFVGCKPPANAKRFVNINEVEQYGISIGSKVKITKSLYTNVSASYIDAQNVDWDEPLAETPPLNIFLSVGYKTNKWMVEFINDFQAKQERVANSVGEKISPSYYSLNLKSSYKPIKALNVGFSIDNIFNENYYQHLSRPYKNMEVNSPFYEVGRNFKILIQYSF